MKQGFVAMDGDNKLTRTYLQRPCEICTTLLPRTPICRDYTPAVSENNRTKQKRDKTMPNQRFSFEFFPTKTEAGHEKLMVVAKQLAGYNPEFFSCTYGAGGST